MDTQRVEKIAYFFDMLGDSNRLNIVVYLSTGKKNVSEITKYLGMSQSAVSHQLRLLKDSGILISSKEGKQVYYDIKNKYIESIILDSLMHITHEAVYEENI